MRIMKEEVLEAMTYPHLAPGQFLQSSQDVCRKQLEKVPNLVMCPAACALAIRRRGVGTVGELVHFCFEHISWVNYRGTTRTEPLSPIRDAEIKRLKKSNNWLDLLSCEWEYLCEKYPTNLPYAKGETVKFVKANFPPYFDVHPVPYLFELELKENL